MYVQKRAEVLWHVVFLAGRFCFDLHVSLFAGTGVSILTAVVVVGGGFEITL